MRRTALLGLLTALALVIPTATNAGANPSSAHQSARTAGPLPGGYHHLVVVYAENHSFDNLLAGWGPVGDETIENAFVPQVDQDGAAFRCLDQNDVNLTSPPQAGSCTDSARDIVSAFTNAPFSIDSYIAPNDATCPPPGEYAGKGTAKGDGEPGGCTRDLIHRFYTEQYQIHGGKQDRYVTASDAIGLSVGRYDTAQLPLFAWLHSDGAPHYVIADRFFQAAFGGSFLNHQFLIAARAPLDTSRGALGATPSVVDSNGMERKAPFYEPTGDVADGTLTQACPNPEQSDEGRACGFFAVNTVYPEKQPTLTSQPRIPAVDTAAYPTIGERLTGKGVPWAWYAGGWDDAVAGRPGPLFQYGHQPFLYFSGYGPGQPGREHLKDEQDFLAAVENGSLPAVSFVKPYGGESEHPGYSSQRGSGDHIVNLLKQVTAGPQAKDTLVVLTYDEFGGFADHVPVPSRDAFGPGTRVPALFLSAGLDGSGIDHTVYDTTSILSTIEQAWGLEPLTDRDRSAHPIVLAGIGSSPSAAVVDQAQNGGSSPLVLFSLLALAVAAALAAALAWNRRRVQSGGRRDDN